MSRGSYALTFLTLLVSASLWQPTLRAQELREQDPKPSGGPHILRLPEGPIRDGEGRRVWVRNQQGDRVVAKVHVQVGEKLVLLMPDGTLGDLHERYTQPATEPFRPMDHNQLAQHLIRGSFAGFKARKSPRFLYIYDCSDEFLARAASILENIHTGVYEYFRKQSYPIDPPSFPLVVVIFEDEADFDEFAALPDGILAYYDTISNHVVMYEKSKLGESAPNLAHNQSMSTVAHEGVHQTLHNIGIQHRLSRWPAWLSEGLPEYFAPTTKGNDTRWKGVGQVNDLRLLQLQSHLRNDEERKGRLTDSLRVDRLDSGGYANAWALTHYFAHRHPDSFHDYVRSISLRGPLQNGGLSPEEQSLKSDYDEFLRYFGSNTVNLDNNVIEHLRGMKFVDPSANDTHYVMLIEFIENGKLTRRAGMTVVPDAVKEWNQAAADEMTTEQRRGASFKVLRFRRKAEALRYAQSWLGSDGVSILGR